MPSLEQGGPRNVQAAIIGIWRPNAAMVIQYTDVFRLLAGVFISWLVYQTFIYPRFLSPLRHLPGPKNDQPLFGQLLSQYRAPSPTQKYLEWSARWSNAPLIHYRGFFNMEHLLINNVEAHKQVLQTNCYSFTKPSLFARLVKDISGKGLLFSEGFEHKHQRKLIANAFSTPNLWKLFPVFLAKAEDLALHIDAKVQEDGGHDEIEVLSTFSKATIDVIGVSTLGIELRNLKSSKLDMDFLQCYERMFNQSPLSAFISFIDAHIPVRWCLPLEASRGFLQASQEVKRMLIGCIHTRNLELAARKEYAAQEFVSRDLLTYMLEERLDKKLELSDEDILGHLLNFLSAGMVGHETTSVSLTWASYILAARPDIQERLRAEIQAFRYSNIALNYGSVDRLPYLNNFVRELLRVFSPAVVLYREAAEDVTICGIAIPKGTVLALPPCATNLSKVIWGEDSLEFGPDRWDQVTGDSAGPYGIESFLNGPRTCLGKQYALIEIKVMLVELLSQFNFSKGRTLLDLGDEPVPLCNPAVSLRPRGGLKVKIQRLST
ncbi:putative Cytochrome P450 3A5 [Seiridium unicorne]|uniref:Cytochrome P450 3A5 n=1 Tax=Seiridium unicorne TaxID=138068 RepID=A0ABR2UHX5_9PEZI